MASQRQWLAKTVLVASTLAWEANAFVDLPFNQKLYFGPDGPWQGVELGYTYSYGGANHPITVLPAVQNPLAVVYLPAPSSCTGFEGELCATGGMIQNFANATSNTWFSSTDAESGWGYNFTGSYRSVNLTLPNTISQYYVDALACTNTTAHYPNGKTLPAQAGLYSLGGDPVDVGVSTPKALHVTELIQSNSFGLHYGSAQLKYPGSLIFGGYDPGRMIGPLISCDTNFVELLDITIGVETGGSPFSFTNKSGLLRETKGQTGAQPTEAFFLPNTPYLYLPEAAVEAITSLLPVKFDSSGYYLWDTSDPSYTKIVSSPAYLGLEFPVSPGSTTSTIIKLPFSLLNLTLETAITGYDTDMPYLPIMATDDPAPSQQSVWLGRTFFQGAYWSVNWGNNASWLAQAPGPGDNNNGLDINPQDMASEATSLSIETDPELFANSWSNHWTVLADSDSGSGAEGSGDAGGSGGDDGNNSSGGSGGGLSGGAIAGIVVGVVVGLALIAALAFFLIRRRRKNSPAYSQPPAQDQQQDQHPAMRESVATSGMPKYGHESMISPQYPQNQWSHTHYDPSPYAQAPYVVPNELAAPEFNGAKELHSESAPTSELPAGNH